MILKNGTVFMADGVFRRSDLHFEERIIGFESVPDDDYVDAEGCLIIPGLVDIHTHGASGRDFSDGSGRNIAALSNFYAAHGVTSFCATTLTIGEPDLFRAMEAVRGFTGSGGAKCAGVNLEGPFLSPRRRGAQSPAHLRLPDMDLFLRLNAASGDRIRLVTVAPELDGALDFIEKASEICTVSIGHSEADYLTASDAFHAGASHVTHLHNAMADVRHREPGIIGAASDCSATVELICDGFHVHPTVVRMTSSVFRSRICAISDSLRCTDMPEGTYDLAGLTVEMHDGKARLTDGTIAGSTISMLDALRNLKDFGVPLESAVWACSTAPAEVIGAGDIGSLSVGKCADLLVLDKNLELVRTYVDGCQVYSNECF